jgi:hypothetical protein
MFKTFMYYSAVLIGGYLALSYASGAGTLLTQGAAGISQIDKTLQGR